MFLRPVLQCNSRGSLGLPKMAYLIGRNAFCSSKTPENGEHPRVTLQFEMADETVVLKLTDRVVGDGKTIYDVAADNKIRDQIPSFGLCGGIRACSTCHVIFDEKDFSKVKERTTDEEFELLSCAPHYCKTSRMSCCIALTKEMDGMVLKIPPGFKDQRIK